MGRSFGHLTRTLACDSKSIMLLIGRMFEFLSELRRSLLNGTFALLRGLLLTAFPRRLKEIELTEGSNPSLTSPLVERQR